MEKLKARYGNALLELSLENNTMDQDLNEGTLVLTVLEDPEVQVFLLHPRKSATIKFEMLQNAFGDKISKRLLGFLSLMLHKNRANLIVPVIQYYIEELNLKMGVTEAKVISAKELTEEELKSISAALAKRLDMKVKLNVTVNPNLIGGFYVEVNGMAFDGSVKSKLTTMKERLKRVN